MLSFCSDNEAPVAPKILESLLEANSGFARSYGEDDLTSQVTGVFREIFECDLEVFPVNIIILGYFLSQRNAHKELIENMAIFRLG